MIHLKSSKSSHRIHGKWYSCIHLVDFYGKCKGKYTSPMGSCGLDALPGLVNLEKSKCDTFDTLFSLLG